MFKMKKFVSFHLRRLWYYFFVSLLWLNLFFPSKTLGTSKCVNKLKFNLSFTTIFSLTNEVNKAIRMNEMKLTKLNEMHEEIKKHFFYLIMLESAKIIRYQYGYIFVKFCYTWQIVNNRIIRCIVIDFYVLKYIHFESFLQFNGWSSVLLQIR